MLPTSGLISTVTMINYAHDTFRSVFQLMAFDFHLKKSQVKLKFSFKQTELTFPINIEFKLQISNNTSIHNRSQTSQVPVHVHLRRSDFSTLLKFRCSKRDLVSWSCRVTKGHLAQRLRVVSSLHPRFADQET